ncbi:hypothetical protein GY45DRAFT_406815 [Cubamyces sp. BRFM 1775]|nr:hypothetical protein GY45DRAFT_406815 [Cubamyces sp. BRFM 1775]
MQRGLHMIPLAFLMQSIITQSLRRVLAPRDCGPFRCPPCSLQPSHDLRKPSPTSPPSTFCAKAVAVLTSFVVSTPDQLLVLAVAGASILSHSALRARQREHCLFVAAPSGLSFLHTTARKRFCLCHPPTLPQAVPLSSQPCAKVPPA